MFKKSFHVLYTLETHDDTTFGTNETKRLSEQMRCNK